jgi:hypothetical protein
MLSIGMLQSRKKKITHKFKKGKQDRIKYQKKKKRLNNKVINMSAKITSVVEDGV